MYTGLGIKAPLFEFGPKCYMYGKELLELCKVADRAALEYDVRVIITPQYVDIRMLAQETDNLLIFAQHMDSIQIGRGMGAILPEALKEAGAVGVMLNHAERPMGVSELYETIKRADEVGLATIVCANTIPETAAIAHFAPNIIVAEQTDLIGTGQTSDEDYVNRSVAAVKEINPEIIVLQGAGISSGADVYRTIKAGADATGCSSGVIKAQDPAAMLVEMIKAVRVAWDESR